MGFHKVDNTLVFRRNHAPRMEYGASNRNHADENEVTPHMEDEIVEVVKASCYEMHNSPS